MALQDMLRSLTGFGHSKAEENTYSENAQTILFPPPDSLSHLTDLASAKRHAKEVWANFLSNQHDNHISGIYSASQLMRVLSLIDIEFDDQKQLNALYVIFTKHLSRFLANEPTVEVRQQWEGFFSNPELFSRDPQKNPQDINNPRCAFQLAPLMQNPQHLLKFMSLWQQEELPWRTLTATGVRNYASKLRSFVGVTIDPLVLKDLIKLFSAPAMAAISQEFFFQSELAVEDEGKFQQNIVLLETLLQASKKDKNPLYCLEPIKHLLTPKYLYALLPIIERIHPNNPKVVRHFLRHPNKQAAQAHPKETTKLTPLRIMVEDLQEAVRNDRLSPIQQAVLEHPLVAREMLSTAELATHKKGLREKHWFLYPLFTSLILKRAADQPGAHRDLENKIVVHTHLDVDLDERVRAAYPRLSRIFGDWARQKFVTDLIEKPRVNEVDYHFICAKVAADPRFNQFLQVKKQLSLFSYHTKDADFLVKTKIAKASPFFASVVFEKSLAESFSDAASDQKMELMIQNDQIKDFIARQAFQGASLLEKLELIQQYQIANAPNPFLKLVDKRFFLLTLQSHLNKLVALYTPGSNQDTPEQKAIVLQLNKFMEALSRANQQKHSAMCLYEGDGVLNFKKILKGLLLINLVNKGLVHAEHQDWLDFTCSARILGGVCTAEDMVGAVKKLQSAAVRADLTLYTPTTPSKAKRDGMTGAPNSPVTPMQAPWSKRVGPQSTMSAARGYSAPQTPSVTGSAYGDDARDDSDSEENLFANLGVADAVGVVTARAIDDVPASRKSVKQRRNMPISPRSPVSHRQPASHKRGTPFVSTTHRATRLLDSTPAARFVTDEPFVIEIPKNGTEENLFGMNAITTGGIEHATPRAVEHEVNLWSRSTVAAAGGVSDVAALAVVNDAPVHTSAGDDIAVASIAAAAGVDATGSVFDSTNSLLFAANAQSNGAEENLFRLDATTTGDVKDIAALAGVDDAPVYTSDDDDIAAASIAAAAGVTGRSVFDSTNPVLFIADRQNIGAEENLFRLDAITTGDVNDVAARAVVNDAAVYTSDDDDEAAAGVVASDRVFDNTRRVLFPAHTRDIEAEETLVKAHGDNIATTSGSGRDENPSSMGAVSNDDIDHSATPAVGDEVSLSSTSAVAATGGVNDVPALAVVTTDDDDNASVATSADDNDDNASVVTSDNYDDEDAADSDDDIIAAPSITETAAVTSGGVVAPDSSFRIDNDIDNDNGDNDTTTIESDGNLFGLPTSPVGTEDDANLFAALGDEADNDTDDDTDDDDENLFAFRP